MGDYQSGPEIKIYDFLIIGSGAAGLAAALYSGRYMLKTGVILGKEFGGATAQAGEIWNYPGFPEGDSFELMSRMRRQAETVGAEMIKGAAVDIRNQESCFQVLLEDSRELAAKAVLLATGAARRKLGLSNEEKFFGRGVHYCVTCDGPVYAGKIIAIVGGGDAAVKGAILAAEYARKVFLIVRGKDLRAEPINRKQLEEIGSKLSIFFETEIREIVGGEKLEKLILSKDYEGRPELFTDGLFVEIGADPATTLAKQAGVALDERGYVRVDNFMATNVSGFYAAGDTVNFFGAFKQTITSAAMGTVAATAAYDYLKKNGRNLCRRHWKIISG